MAEFLVCFNWCSGEHPQPKRRRRLDRNMIGEPMNFVHTAHVGTRDMNSGFTSCWVNSGPYEVKRWLHKWYTCKCTAIENSKGDGCTNFC
ncbi:unnamed protein product [Lepidochelys olivacea]